MWFESVRKWVGYYHRVGYTACRIVYAKDRRNNNKMQANNCLDVFVRKISTDSNKGYGRTNVGMPNRISKPI